MLARLIQDENTFPYVPATSYHQKQFPVSWRPLLYTAWKWWPRTAERCHLKSLCCTWWIRINAINCGVLVMGKAMKQVPKQEQATFQIIIPQLRGDQKAMTVWWPYCPLMSNGLGVLVQPLPEVCVRCNRATNSVPGGRLCSLHFLPLGSSYTSGWKHCWKWPGGSWHWYLAGQVK